MITENAVDEAENKVCAQINILSDMYKGALEDAVKEKLGRTIAGR